MAARDPEAWPRHGHSPASSRAGPLRLHRLHRLRCVRRLSSSPSSSCSKPIHARRRSEHSACEDVAACFAFGQPLGLQALQTPRAPSATSRVNSSVLKYSMSSGVVGSRCSTRSVGIPRAWFNQGIRAFAAARSPPPADRQSSLTALSTFAVSATRASATIALVPSAERAPAPVWSPRRTTHRGGVPSSHRLSNALPSQLPSHRFGQVRLDAIWLEQVPGEGVEPSRPRWGQLILSQPRIANFATPARRRIPRCRNGYAPGVRMSTGNRSGPLPRNASRNVLNAFSLKPVQTAR
jgi:hypothetical protein